MKAKRQQSKEASCVAMREAETFVRRVAMRLNQKVDDDTVRAVAHEVSKAIPPYPDKERLNA